MGKIYESIDNKLEEWIKQQKLFFVATAPLGKEGHINCSPKGGDAFRVLSDTAAAYQDLTGSGAETIAHLEENGRIVIMFCAFDGPPKIVRLHGRGKVVTQNDDLFEELSNHFPPHVGTRAIIHIQVSRISDSCGFSVPLYEYQADRDILDKWSVNQGDDGLKEYREKNNMQSIDGLPALSSEFSSSSES